MGQRQSYRDRSNIGHEHELVGSVDGTDKIGDSPVDRRYEGGMEKALLNARAIEIGQP